MMTIKEAIEVYLSRGFGSMTKNDFEVWIFHQLLQGELKDKSNYDISRRLKITESKVKRLRYEADLKYVDDLEAEPSRINKLNDLLENAVLKRDGTRIQFVVEDPAVRKYLDHLLKLKRSFSDSSFNSEIVSVTLDDYEMLLDLTDADGTKKAELIKQARKKLNDDEITFQGLLKKFAEGAASQAGSTLVTKGLSWAGLLAKLALM